MHFCKVEEPSNTLKKKKRRRRSHRTPLKLENGIPWKISPIKRTLIIKITFFFLLPQFIISFCNSSSHSLYSVLTLLLSPLFVLPLCIYFIAFSPFLSPTSLSDPSNHTYCQVFSCVGLLLHLIWVWLIYKTTTYAKNSRCNIILNFGK